MEENNINKKVFEFFSKYKKVEFKSDTELFSPNHEINYIYYLIKGNVKQYSITESGEEVAFHLFQPKSYIPMGIILSELDNKYYFQTLGECECFKAPAEEVVEFLKENLDVLFDLTQRLAKGLHKMLTRTESYFFKDSELKLKNLLIFLCEKFGEEKDENFIKIRVVFTHSDLASWIGVQRETISRQLEKFKKQNIISYEGKNIILNMNLIEKVI